MAKGHLYVVSAPSGGGKTSLIRTLIREMNDIVVSITYTTRAMRPGETNGVDYHFIDETTFKAMKAEQAFLESASVFGHHYGTSKARIQEHIESGCDVVLPIDWQGFRVVKKIISSTIGIFIIPPSLSVLKSRLRNRAQDNESVIESRMAEAQSEMQHYNEYDYLIINDDFGTALSELQTIVRAERLRLASQEAKYRDLLINVSSN